MKLEKNHIPLCQADHWIWNMGMDVGVMRDRVFRSCSPMMPLQPGLGYRWSKEEGAKHVHSGDDKAKDAMGATLDQMDPGVPLEELVWTQSAHYFTLVTVSCLALHTEDQLSAGTPGQGKLGGPGQTLGITELFS